MHATNDLAGEIRPWLRWYGHSHAIAECLLHIHEEGIVAVPHRRHAAG